MWWRPWNSWMYSRECFRNVGSSTLSSTELCSCSFIGGPLKTALGKRGLLGNHCTLVETSAFQTIFAALESQSCMCLLNMAVVPEGSQVGPWLHLHGSGFGQRASLRPSHSTESASNSCAFRLIGWDLRWELPRGREGPGLLFPVPPLTAVTWQAVVSFFSTAWLHANFY